MEISAKPEISQAGYANKEPTNVPNWHSLIVWDMLFNALSTGLFLTAACCELAASETFASVTRLAYPLALVCLMVDLVCLVFDLGDPRRFHHMLRVFKPTSPMSLGTWSLTAYSLPLTLIVAQDLLLEGITPTWFHTALVVLGVLPALLSVLYKGVLFSTTAQPGWRDARWLGGYHAANALTLGCALLLALAVLQSEEIAVATLRRALGVLVVASLLFQGLLLADLSAAIWTRKSIYYTRLVSALAMCGGTILPLILLYVGGSLCLLLSSVFLIASHYLVRHAIVKIPHSYEADPVTEK